MKKNKKLKDEPDFRKYFKTKKGPEHFVESNLIELSRANARLRDFWEDYRLFLSKEREKRLDDIKDALFSSRLLEFESINMSRIVSGDYDSCPLSTAGSVKKAPGGRFNFGSISSSLIDFHCLYVANNFKTAFAEKYHYAPDEKIGEGQLTPEELSLEKPGSFLHCLTKVSLENVIDIRNTENLNGFIEVVSEIKPPAHLQKQATKLKLGRLYTTQTTEALLGSLMEDNYTQWGIQIGQPSNSQWFGHYAMAAGLQAIIYPSARNLEGFNLAIFPDNFEGSNSSVAIQDKIQHVESDQVEINGSNYKFFRDNQKTVGIH